MITIKVMSDIFIGAGEGKKPKPPLTIAPIKTIKCESLCLLKAIIESKAIIKYIINIVYLNLYYRKGL